MNLQNNFTKPNKILQEVLEKWDKKILPFLPEDLDGLTKNVLLVDASVVRQDGKKQEQQRIHMCYSLNQGRMYKVKVTDQHTADFVQGGLL